jgi:signal transduction histidine kinase
MSCRGLDHSRILTEVIGTTLRPKLRSLRMEVPDEFTRTPLEEIQRDLSEIQLRLLNIENLADQIYYKRDEEQEKYLKKIEKSIDNLSNQIQAMGEESRREIKYHFEMISARLDYIENDVVNSRNGVIERVDWVYKSLSGRFVFIFRNLILFLIFVLLFYIAAK